MIIVNPNYINQIFAPLIGGADYETDFNYYSIDTDDEEHVKKMARDILLPEFKMLIPELQHEVKTSFTYYITNYRKLDFDSRMDSLLLPLKTPKDPVLFFRWLWQVFCEGEPFDYIWDSGEIVEEFDVSASLKLIFRVKGIEWPHSDNNPTILKSNKAIPPVTRFLKKIFRR
ncbi:MAG TPA: hypothetical protein VG738_22420 [Chitinophagaceae bacterium]|nr:hypothetical protein [Chitinophagaceae bacterium]